MMDFSVFEALKALPAAVVRGAERTMPLPTVSYLSEEKEGEEKLSLTVRAYQMEQADALMAGAVSIMEGLGYACVLSSETEEKDTDVRVRRAAFVPLGRGKLTAGGHRVKGIRQMTEEKSFPAPAALPGGARPSGGKSLHRLTVRLYPRQEDEGQKAIWRTGRAKFVMDGERFDAFAVKISVSAAKWDIEFQLCKEGGD